MSMTIDEIRQVEIVTAVGSIRVAVNLAAAPVTAANFLTYVESGLLDGTEFYRIVAPCNQGGRAVPIDVVQGGFRETVKAPLPPIIHEPTWKTGLRHRDGTISMARYAPGTAAGAFFICVGDQPVLDHGGPRNPDGEGFAAFGRVVRGMDIVRSIWARAESDAFIRKPVPILSAAVADDGVPFPN
ncbi:peptidylprolyl isomerase [Sphingomonas crocodyli]|uniref:peptidylprolyl isomerase n=1 Tax=Sphingomonas crocodyli TaxID=1979270 RepID=A0A437M5G6_9SPHN|nr:peptidylprolyl isomerase [Sphingomonas crocodyli]RVT92970.1 peptidylprolyl isomerase [Sphingomonas crocodyli]